MNKSYSIKPYQLRSRLAVIVAAAVFMTGCASTPPPTAQMAVSRAAITNANSAGANEFAPLQIKSANEKMAGAERAMVDEEYGLAGKLAAQAQVDAELAGEKARSAKAQKAADAVQEDSNVLRQEIDRNTQ